MKKNGIQIKIGPVKTGVPVYKTIWSPLSRAIYEMKKGDYREFTGPQRWLQTQISTTGNRYGYKMVTRKLNGTGIAAWRIK